MCVSQNPLTLPMMNFPFYIPTFTNHPINNFSEEKIIPFKFPSEQVANYEHRTIIVIQQGCFKQMSSADQMTKQSIQNKNKCPYCEKVFKFRIQYFRHLSDRYRHCQQKFGQQFIPDRVTKKPKIYVCKQCSHSYTQKSALRRHQKNKKHR